MLHRCGLVAVAAAVLVLFTTFIADAACNSIPSADNVHTDVPTLVAPSSSPSPHDAESHSFKLALGRIDKLYLYPGSTRTFRLETDGICVRKGAPAVAAHGPAAFDDLDDVAVFLALPVDAGKRVVIRAHVRSGLCEPLRAAMRVKARDERGPSFELADACSNDLRIVTGDSGARELEVSVPDFEEIASLRESNAVVTPVIVATRIGAKTAEQLVALVENAVLQSCEQTCAQLLDAGALACGSSVYALTLGPSGKAYQPDPIPCQVTMPAGLAKNDFKKQCSNAPGIDPSLPQCDAQPDKLSFWEDKCGGIHIPFTWLGVRGGSGTAGIDRWVGGSSAAGRKKAADMSSIYVPGREFVGSTPVSDPQGTQPGTKWRRPLIDVSYGTEAAQPFGLVGVVDQDDSTVHVFPRLRASVFCDSGADEACMGIDTITDNGDLTCACTDRYAPTCQCKPPDASIPRYFACQGGTMDGMPCTRDSHCNPGGTCTQKPFCQARGAVWEAGGGAGTGTQCWVDDDCLVTSDKLQCGYLLFNFDDRKKGNGVVDLDTEIVSAGKKERGTCSTPPFAACSNGGAGSPAACASGTCTGYLLQAGGRP